MSSERIDESKQKRLVFGLSTTPVKDVKSDLLKEIERNMLKLVYLDKK